MSKRTLPGDTPHTLASMLRVDHAGEYGARRIYAGQLAVLKGQPCADEIRHMAEQEDVHLDAFNKLLPEYGVRPSMLQPFWHVAGYALGAATAMMGPKAAMACTVAVEEVIAEHYDRQIEALPEEQGELKAMLQKFRDEEQEHHDTGIAHGAEETPGYALLSGAIRAGCKLAIRIAEKY